MRWASTQLATPSILISTDMGSRDKSTTIEIPNDDSTIAIGNQCHLVPFGVQVSAKTHVDDCVYGDEACWHIGSSLVSPWSACGNATSNGQVVQALGQQLQSVQPSKVSSV